MSKVLALIFGGAISIVAQGADWVSAPHGVLERQDIEKILQKYPLAAEENIRVVPLQKNERSVQFLVQIRQREPLHHHADSDISVFLLRGHGRIRIADRTQPMRAGDILHIPRGLVHAYINDGPEIAVAFVVYSPAPGPNDRVLAEPAEVKQK